MSAVVRATINPHRRLHQVPPPSGDAVLRFHEDLPDYRPTPLRRFDTDGPGVVYVKDESDRLGLPAFKILGASWAVERALAIDPEIAVVVAASAGNHGRAVARAAAWRGIACRIHLPRSVSRERAEPIAGEGAQVIAVDGDYDTAVAAAQHAANEPGVALIADTGTGAAAAWVIDGYTTLFREAAAQAPGPFDLVIVPIGVGSLAAAAVRFAVHQQPAAMIVGVEPDTAACVTASLHAGRRITVVTSGTTMTGMDCATPSATAWPTLHAGLTGTISVCDAEAHTAMRVLAGQGIRAGDCGAATIAALHALRDDALCHALRDTVCLDRSSRVLCISTEGATDPGAYMRIVSQR